ncbi:unnamed protein product [Ectocarpus sp. 13 AM-2016]
MWHAPGPAWQTTPRNSRKLGWNFGSLTARNPHAFGCANEINTTL